MALKIQTSLTTNYNVFVDASLQQVGGCGITKYIPVIFHKELKTGVNRAIGGCKHYVGSQIVGEMNGLIAKLIYGVTI